MMFYPKVAQDYIKLLQRDPEGYRREFEDVLRRTHEERKLYHDTVIPMTYQGMFFEEPQQALFSRIIERMVAIGRKVAEAFVCDPTYRRGFHFDPVTEKLILMDPGYDMPVPVGRYDIFYNGGEEFAFCELNTDGSSAMNEDRVLGSILLGTRAFRELQKTWQLQPYELFYSLVKALLARYRQVRGRDARTAAIVDFAGLGTEAEFRVFQQTFRTLGVPCLVCDPRAMRFEKGKLLGTDTESGKTLPVDLVYRRVVTSDFVERIDECADFLAAYQAHAFVMFGSFRSQIMHSKLIFRMLSDPQTQALLTEEENAFIAAHVPLTRELLTEADRKKIIENKEDYILKPYNSYASQGIWLGREHDADSWRAIVEALPLNAYIYQQYIEVEPTPFIEVRGDDLRLTKLGHVIGLFLYDEHFAGSYTRVGAQGIISGAREYYSAPVFLARPRG